MNSIYDEIFCHAVFTPLFFSPPLFFSVSVCLVTVAEASSPGIDGCTQYFPCFTFFFLLNSHCNDIHNGKGAYCSLQHSLSSSPENEPKKYSPSPKKVCKTYGAKSTSEMRKMTIGYSPYQDWNEATTLRNS